MKSKVKRLAFPILGLLFSIGILIVLLPKGILAVSARNYFGRTN